MFRELNGVMVPDGRRESRLMMERLGKSWNRKEYMHFGPLRLHKLNAGLRREYAASRSEIIQIVECTRCGVTYPMGPSLFTVGAVVTSMRGVLLTWSSSCNHCRSRPSMGVIIRAADAWIKANSPCVDCGYFFIPRAMEWDHLPEFEKVADVSVLRRSGNLGAYLDEIAKCDLVCANCHRVRTQVRCDS